MTFVQTAVRLSLPATSANLGPGYDSLALALTWRDHLEAVVTESELRISVEGRYAGGVPLDETHLVVRAMDLGFQAMGLSRPGLSLTCTNSIPHGRGLGSSAAAIVGGLCLARGLVLDGADRLDDAAVLQIAAELEGHPDNVAATLFGSLVIAGVREPDEIGEIAETDRYFAHRASVHPDLAGVVFIPIEPVPTSLARSLLPASVPHRDAAANAGRAALLVAAISTAPELLFTATRDFLHQEYRHPVLPRTMELVRSLRAAGAAAMVSGAGPTVLVLSAAADVGGLLAWCPEDWEARVVRVDPDGVRLD